MSKTRIHDLAAEFSIPTEQLLKLLAEMDIHVRSHLSAIDAGQVALVRARWEREKRKRAAPATTTRRRRATKKTTKRKTVEKAPTETRPKRRRRTAAEVEAKAEEQAAEDARREGELVEPTIAVPPIESPEPKPSLEERAAALFREEETRPAEPTPEAVALPEGAAQVASAPPSAPEPVSAPQSVTEELRPTPVTSGLRPVASAAPRGRSSLRAAPPPAVGSRPVAAAAPHPKPTDDRRGDRDRKKRKKTKRTQVDQQAVQANISRTLASLRGSVQKKSPRRRGDEPTFREIQQQRLAEEKEREKTLIRVNEYVTVSELAGMLNVTPTDIVGFCFKEPGMMVTVNQRLDFVQI